MKTFGGVVLGYLMMVAFVFLSFSIAYRIMGADRAFQPGVYDVTNLWIITSFMLGLAGAILGGYVCETVALDGFAFAVPVLTTTSPSAPREGDVSNTVAMQNAQQPPWVALLNPLFGAIGVLIGAGARSGRGEPPSDPAA
jgi:hypothetical protein